MAEKSPTTSRSISKETDSIAGDNINKQSEDEYEDSLNISISEHISEEIESNNNSGASEDSIEKSNQRIDQSVADKKRQLFAFDDSDRSDKAANFGLPTFSRFQIDGNLSGENIAKHFLAESSPVENTQPKNVEKSSEKSKAEPSPSLKEIEKCEESTSRHQNNDGNLSRKDVILINDHEISIDSLKLQQKQKSDSDHANTISDVSDLINEDNAKDSKSIEDIPATSINESESKPSDKSANADADNTESESDKVYETNDEMRESEIMEENDEIIQKCRPMVSDSMAELSVIDEVSRDDELSSNQHISENSDDKQNAIRKIIDDTVDQLPIGKENRAPNLRDDLMSTDSKYMASSQNSTATDGTVYNAFANADANISNELNLYLTNIESKIKELHCMDLSRVLGNDTSSRRDSLKDSLKDMPQSSREAVSITTTSTEYRPFPDEYFRLTDFQIALNERDQIIKELTQSLKQSIEKHDVLVSQVKQLKENATPSVQRKWLIDRNCERLSETTIDLVSESEFEDDELNRKSKIPKSGPFESVEEFKTQLNSNERGLFATVEDKFNVFVTEKVRDMNEQVLQHELEKGELETEMSRVRLLLVNIKNGTVDEPEWRTELKKQHKREMEDLRRYFERKCSDMEKHYSEEVFSQHSRRHSNDTNSDFSDDDILLPDDARPTMSRYSKAGDILSSPTHRKLTPTHIRSNGSSPIKRLSRGNLNGCSSLGKLDDRNRNADEIHEYYSNVISSLKRSHEEKEKQLAYKLQKPGNFGADDEYLLTATTSTEPLLLLTNENLKTNTEYVELFNNLVCEYDRRLDEQVKLAKQDMLNELEAQIQTLLSESSPQENRWPPELILLRENFTAKSQLEIAQLQIKHEEEMSRLKVDHQRQLDRKHKRQNDFDNGRDLEKCEVERDDLRELCNTFRNLLHELAKCVSVCEDDLNASLVDELNKYGILEVSKQSPPKSPPLSPIETDLNQSTCSSVANRSMRISLVPDVSGILSLIEDPTLISFVTEKLDVDDSFKDFKLNDCLERLKSEADLLLQLSEKLVLKKAVDNKELHDKDKPFEKIDEFNVESIPSKPRLSLPFDVRGKLMSNSDLNDLKNRLVLTETKNQELEKKLAETIIQRDDLMRKIASSQDSQSEEISEGYGISQLRSPQRQSLNKSETSFSALQERAKLYFNDSNATENVSQMLQLLEEFCREGDKLIEEEKDAKKDLEQQIVAAYNQRKQDLEFLEKQAAERESERDDFCKKIEKFETKIRDIDKERLKYDNISKESETLRQQVQDIESSFDQSRTTNSKLQTDLKDSINKIYDLREIIVELENQITAKNNQLKAIEQDMDYQKEANESLQIEMKSLLTQTEITPAYEEKIQQLEEQLESLQPNSEQSAAIDRIAVYLREIEDNLDRKTTLLESVHISTGIVTTCSSPSEDVSVRGSTTNLDASILSPRTFNNMTKDPSFPVNQITRIIEKIQKHSKVEEAAIKLVRDLEMQIKALHNSYMELQNERDLLKEKMDEQLLRLTTIQSRLDEQRQRAEELQRAGTTDLNLKVYDLRAEIAQLKETVSARDKQITVLRSHLTQSKEVIDRQESEISSLAGRSLNEENKTCCKDATEKLQREMVAREMELKQLREKMRNEMITKVALPDLMETMLEDKTSEIDYLKTQLSEREKELSIYQTGSSLNLFSKHLSQDFEHKDHIRDAPKESLTLSLNTEKFFERTPASLVDAKNTQFSPKLAADSIRSIDLTDNKYAELTIQPPSLTFEEKNKMLDDLTIENMRAKEKLELDKQKLDGEIVELKRIIDSLESKITSIERKLSDSDANCMSKCVELDSINTQLNKERANNHVLKTQLDSMDNTIKLKDELISKYQKDLYNYTQNETLHLEKIRRLQDENEAFNRSSKHSSPSKTNQNMYNEIDQLKEALAETERELNEKMIAYEKALLDIAEQEKIIFHLNDVLTDSKTAKSVEELRIEIRNHREQTDELKKENNDLKQRLLAAERIDVLADENIDEIANRVEEELNYSAQLDSSIIKAAMESDGNSSDKENLFDRNKADLEAMRLRNKQLESKIDKLQQALEIEREKNMMIRKQDANCIETISKRLEAAMENQSALSKSLDVERAKSARLSTRMLEEQFERSKLSASNLSLNESLSGSPKREPDQYRRQSDEIKSLKVLLEREKERSTASELLQHEKTQLERKVSEQRVHADNAKSEMNRAVREKQLLQTELDQTLKRLTSSLRDHENIQSKLRSIESNDNGRTFELQKKLIHLEKDRDILAEKVSILQTDLDKSAQREQRLTESLTNVAGYSVQSQQQNTISNAGLLSKLKEMNDHLSENVRENRQLSETLQLLTEERHELQKKVRELEQLCFDREEYEERANHLMGKYLRTESFRRALIHQKRYLMVVLNTYENNESKVLSSFKNGVTSTKHRDTPSFKSVVLMVIAIERMKFILRRWQTGKRVCTRNTIFAHSTPPRRTASASMINWARSEAQLPNILQHPQSPPIRDKPMNKINKTRRGNNGDLNNQI